jgi:hypothetical protein
MTDGDTIREALRGSTGYKVDSALAALDRLVAERDEARRERDKARLSVEGLSKRLTIAVATEARVTELLEAAMALYERVQMDESVGICLSERVTTLALGAALADKEGT